MEITQVTNDRYGLEVEVSNQPEPWTFCASRYSKETTIEDAVDFFGEPRAGILLGYRGGEWFYCDGVNPNTGKNFTADEVLLLTEVFTEVEVLK